MKSVVADVLETLGSKLFIWDSGKNPEELSQIKVVGYTIFLYAFSPIHFNTSLKLHTMLLCYHILSYFYY